MAIRLLLVDEETNDPSWFSRGMTSSKQRNPAATAFVAICIAGLVLPISSVSAFSPRIQVCQNKDCCQRWQGRTPLPDVLHDLLGLEITTTSCLSQCGKGPNVCVTSQSTGRDEVYLNGLLNPTTAAARLEALSDDFQIPSKLLAAVNVLEKAHSASSTEEKERFVSSIIRALESEPELARSSTALARAYVFRADLLHDGQSETRYEDAIVDAKRAIELLQNLDFSDATATTLKAKAYRIMADVYEKKAEFREAVDALRAQAACQPSMRTKIVKEIERLQQQA